VLLATVLLLADARFCVVGLLEIVAFRRGKNGVILLHAGPAPNYLETSKDSVFFFLKKVVLCVGGTVNCLSTNYGCHCKAVVVVLAMPLVVTGGVIGS